MTNRVFIGHIDAAQAHREAYIAIIRSALHGFGHQKEFAQELGIEAPHLSNMLNPGLALDGEVSKVFKRTPDPELAKRMVSHLPIGDEVRQSLWEHLEMVWEGERAALIPYTSQRWLTRYTIDDLLGDIGQEHVAATHTSNPEDARHKYLVLQRACKLIVGRINPYPDQVNNDDLDVSANPLEFAQVSLFLHDVQCVLDRGYDALAHAKYSYEVMAACDPDGFPNRVEYFDHLLVNTAVAECLAYRNMGLVKEAIDASLKAENLVSDRGSRAAQFWLPHIYMHRLKALIETPRFTVGDVDGLVRQVEEAYIRRPGDFEYRWQIHLIEARARGYLQYGIQSGSQLRLRRAGELLRDIAEQIDHCPLGPVHKTSLLRTYARIQWNLGIVDAWQHYILLALRIAVGAGLEHQIAQSKKEYGVMVSSMIQELRSPI